MGNYSITRDMSASEVFTSPETDDLTGDSISVSVTASGTVTVLPQYSTDTGSTWNDDDAGSYTVTAETDTRTITIPSGLLRFIVTESAGTPAASTLTILIIASTTSSTGVVTTADVYRAIGFDTTIVSDEDMKAYILRAYSEARIVTGRPAGSEQTTEYHHGNNKTSMYLFHSPVVSLDTLTIGTTDITPGYVDVVEATGQMILKSTAEAGKFTLLSNDVPNNKYRNVTAVYTWGYYDVPYWYNRLVEILAGIMALTQKAGSSFDDVTSYTIGDVSASKGEPYTNLRATIVELRREKDDIIARYVKKAVAIF